jgi:hypothetical protein
MKTPAAATKRNQHRRKQFGRNLRTKKRIKTKAGEKE